MKRILSVLLIVLVFLSLFGCNGETAETAENKATAETKENLEPNPPEDFEYHLMKDGDAVTITKYTGKDEYVVIPKQIEGKSVTAIAQNCFQNAKSFLKAVTLPDTIETIGRMAFSDCSFLSSINLPKSLSQIETCAFRNCISLKKVQILSNCLNKNSSEAFAYSGLETIILGEGVKYIPPFASQEQKFQNSNYRIP